VKPSSEADYCRELAARCARQAANVKTAAGRQQLATIGNRYFELADQFDKLDKVGAQAAIDRQQKNRR
jgi:hypothetical protein